MTETPRTTPELDEAISGLCAIHARLLREIQEAQAQKFPGAVWTEKQAWEDAASLIIALVELERAKAALVLDREVSALRDAAFEEAADYCAHWFGYKLTPDELSSIRALKEPKP